MKIGFVRRGFSPSGGAENYLQRLARGVQDAGHAVELFTTHEWPAEEWTVGKLTPLHAGSPVSFANEVENAWRAAGCDSLMSLERVWRCNIYRAGDGVHRAWLARRAKLDAAQIHHPAQPQAFRNFALGRSLIPETRRGSRDRKLANGEK